jgi:hypothetical protein
VHTALLGALIEICLFDRPVQEAHLTNFETMTCTVFCGRGRL